MSRMIGGARSTSGSAATLWHGDVTARERRGLLDDPAELLMTTPESLEVMLASARSRPPSCFEI
jgi:Lhr-like helicase